MLQNLHVEIAEVRPQPPTIHQHRLRSKISVRETIPVMIDQGLNWTIALLPKESSEKLSRLGN